MIKLMTNKNELGQDLLDLSFTLAQRTSEYVQQHSVPHTEEIPFKFDPPEHHKMARKQFEMAMKEEAIDKGENSKDVVKGKAQTFYLLREVSSEPQGMQDITKSLIHQEMLSAGLLKFDDPKNYWSRKASFQSSTKDLNPFCQGGTRFCDLVAWYGVCRAGQEDLLGACVLPLKLAWQRLEECNGSPQVIENALLKKVKEWPKLTNKEGHRLERFGPWVG